MDSHRQDAGPTDRAATQSAHPDFKRRTVITAILSATAVAAIGLQGPLAVGAEGSGGGLAAFTRLSEFSTNRKLDPVLGARFYDALKKRNAKLDDEVAGALAHIDAAKPADIDAFLDTIDATTKATITGIVSAWYLGFVGEGKDVELISYAGALMYESTRGILVVPSYGGGPNSWGPKPV